MVGIQGWAVGKGGWKKQLVWSATEEPLILVGHTAAWGFEAQQSWPAGLWWTGPQGRRAVAGTAGQVGWGAASGPGLGPVAAE